MDPFLARCLYLAAKASSAVYPNPRVGALIVCEGKIIGEGFHAFVGGPHAEVCAVASVEDPSLLEQSTLYVSLEPCNHQGRTPPCTELILERKIPRVLVGCEDPNPRVAGQGIARLRAAGVRVELAPELAPFQALNSVFFTNQLEARPYMVLKWAQSADGYLAAYDLAGEAQRTAISGELSQVYVHHLRAWHHAILVGRHTAAVDNPSLNTRLVFGRDPLRIVLDRYARLPEKLNLFSDGRDTLVLSDSTGQEKGNLRWHRPNQWSDLRLLMQELYLEQGICSILVEGGSNLLQQFLSQGFWDEIHIFQSPLWLGKGVPAPVLPAGVKPAEMGRLGEDVWYRV